MRFATKQDIEAPIRAVFDSLTNFETWERAAMRRGAEVDRIDRMAGIGPGMVWQTQFQYRSKARKLRLELTHIETPHHLAFAALSDVLEGTAQIELLELGTKRTRMQVVVEITPRTLTARLFLQSLRLARARIDRKFDQRVAQFAALIETQHRTMKPF